MPSLEIEGKSIEEAIQAACQQLNVPKEKLDIQIINSGSTGIFGIVGSKKAKIRATLIEEAPEKFSQTESDTLIPSSTTDFLAEAKMLTQEILGLMGLEFILSAVKERDTIYIQIEGDEASSVLIGRSGQTLDAVQYLLTRILNRKGLGRTKIILDCGDYRSRRKNYLETLALKMAEKAKKTGKPAIINPLNAHDRRIIHLVLEKEKSLKAISRGEGHLKKMVISLIKKDRPQSPPTQSET
ncbi:MAG TPA: RNA-binding cell elongation regulator Jag/EloR [Thermodesulfobacteriota bacterium]|nr:RNA-binding cell elongation regulator Jag/EloR [Thermodesulfobacteriota bacterium]